MHVIQCRNVREALPLGLEYLYRNGRVEDSRAGRVLVAPTPVTTVYSRPIERVLTCPVRNANPFFHLFEALWMLAGRNDATWLDQFVGDFSKRFAEGDGRMHGAYGHRWRQAFGFDQLDAVVKKLKENPSDRQAVIQMWDISLGDLMGTWKDRPCNTHIYLRVRTVGVLGGYTDKGEPATGPERALDMTVCCRSNDIVWGAYGSNAVHFSILQEVLAAKIGAEMGYLYQISNNYHVYTDVLEKVRGCMGDIPKYVENPTPIVTKPNLFGYDLGTFFEFTNNPLLGKRKYVNRFFNEAEIMFLANHLRRYPGVSRELLELLPQHSDWRVACTEWIERRSTSKPEKAA